MVLLNMSNRLTMTIDLAEGCQQHKCKCKYNGPHAKFLMHLSALNCLLDKRLFILLLVQFAKICRFYLCISVHNELLSILKYSSLSPFRHVSLLLP